MIGENLEVSLARRRLATRLRELRLDASLSGETLGVRMSVSQSKVSRIETGKAVPSLREVEDWAKACEVTSEVTSEVLGLAEAALTEASSWRREHFTGMRAKQLRIQQLEAEAPTIRVFQDTIVPGLLQTAEYARRVFDRSDVVGDQDTALAASGRLERQQVLFDESKQLTFLIYEAALRWRIGPPSVMRAQLDRIASLSTLPNVEIGIIQVDLPFDPQMILPNGFELLGELDDGLVLVETVTAELSIRDKVDVAVYISQFKKLRELALIGEQARELLTALSHSLE